VGHLPLIITVLFAAAPLATADLPLLRYVSQSVREQTGAWSHEAQGLAHDDSAWFVTQRHQIWRLPLDHDLSRPIEGTDHLHGVRRADIPTALRRRGYAHLGDPAVWRDLVLVPLEGRGRRPLVLSFRADGLRFMGATELPQRKAPWLAVGEGDVLYSSDFHIHRARPLHRYRLRETATGAAALEPRPAITLRTAQGEPARVRRIQGGVLDPRTGHLVLVSDTDRGGLVLVDLRDGTLLGRQPVDVRRGFPFYEELQGITWWDTGAHRGRLHVVMLDNDLGTDAVYVKHFR